MQTFKSYLKKLLLVYIVSISIVIVYFIIKTIMPQDQGMALKSFTKDNGTQEILNEEAIAEVNNTKKFLLLPAK